MKRVSIVGAGLVGSLLAILLRRRGFEVDLFERRPDPRLQAEERGRSINLVITSRGLRALRETELVRTALELAVPVNGRMIHGLDGSTFFQPYGQEGECNYSISRIELNKFLISAAEANGARVYFEHTLESLDLDARKATFSSPAGTTPADYEVLFGADGAGSRVRKALCDERPKMFHERTDWLEADYKELFIPKNNGLQRDALHIWPRGALMMMALANLDGSFTVTLYMPKTGETSFATAKDHTALEKLVRSQFADAESLMPTLYSDFFHNPQGTLGTVRMNNWIFEDSVALIGDAAHAIVPFFGQGMNAGFEDCSILAGLLDQHGSDWRAILPAYQAERKVNTDAIADMALENWVEMKERVADPKFQIRKKIESLIEQKHPGAYKSRYGLITYTLTPYKLAQEAGELQSRFLDDLVRTLDSADQAPWDKVENFLQSDWKSFLEKKELSLEHYVP